MGVHFRIKSGAVVLSLLFLSTVFGAVRINEINALSSDRLLQWSDSGVPRLGSGVSWWANDFDDSTWPSVYAPIGFNYNQVVTDLSADMYGLIPSVYLRKTFTVTAVQAASAVPLLLDIDYDDGFIAYLNGIEVARANMGAAGGFGYVDQPAFNAHVWTTSETFNLGWVSDLLQEGENVLSIQLHNHSISSGNLLLDAGLKKTAGGTVYFVSKGDTWQYFVGQVEPSGGVFDPAFITRLSTFRADWTRIDFSDDSWSVGAGPLGYDAGTDYPLGTDLDNMRYNQSVLYTRKSFQLDALELASISSLTLTVDFDDGYVAFLNGTEIVRANLGTSGGFVPFNATATTYHNASMDNGENHPEWIQSIEVDQALLVEGANVLAIQMCNQNLGSSDLMVIADLITNSGAGPQLVTHTELHRYFIGTEEPGAVEDNSEAAVEPTFVDWIELYNDAAVPIDLTGWSLSDDGDDPRKWIFPEGTQIEAEGYLLVLADAVVPEDGAATHLHANFKLSADGEFLGLYDAGGIARTVFNPEFPRQYDFHVYGVDPAGGTSYGYLSEPTPGAPNSGSLLSGRADAPDFSHAGGFHSGAVTLSLSSETAGATIRYTTDGSEPTATHGVEYVSPIVLAPISDKAGHVIRARTFAEGMIGSKVKTHTYLIDQHPDLKTAPALIFTGDEDRTLYRKHGIMAIEGGTYIPEGYDEVWQADGIDSYHIPLQRGRAFERPVHLELYFNGEEEGVREDVGLRLSASDWSRPRLRLTHTDDAPWPSSYTEKPSFNIFFRNDYGAAEIDDPWLSENYPVERYEQLRVRAGKNDIKNPFVVDEMMRRLYTEMGHHSANGINTTVYINGELKGFFNLTERLREPFFQAHHDSTEEWDVVQVWEFANGDNVKWNEMFALLWWEDLSVLANYQAVEEMLDVDNFIDYLLLNTYGATWDWPQSNWVAARERSETGLFRFYVWDAEAAIGLYGRPPGHDTIQLDLIDNVNGNSISTIFKSLQNSPEFRLRWADRIQKHFFNGGVLDDRDAPNSSVWTHWDELVSTHQPLLSYIHNETVDSSRMVNWTDSSAGRRTYLFGPNDTQFANHDLWPALQSPEFSQHGGDIPSEYLLTLSHSSPAGAIVYYTTDGTDPRLAGGALAPTATAYADEIELTKASTHVKARVFVPSAGEWSPLNEATFSITVPAVLVNEVLTHTDLPEVDTIELYNPGSDAIHLGGWFLTDDFSDPYKFSIPDGTIIPAGGYLVFDENDFSNEPDGFRLSEYGEQVYLFSGTIQGELTGYSQGWNFNALPNGVSIGSYIDNLGRTHFVPQQSTTLGAENSAPLMSPVIVSEIHYHPPDLAGDIGNVDDEFIELMNVSTATTPLHSTDLGVPGYGTAALNDTWRLRNAVDYDFPAGIALAPGQRILVVGFDPSTDHTQLESLRSTFNIPDHVDIYGPWSGKLNNSGEELELKYPGSADPEEAFFVPYYMAEEIDYTDVAPWPEEADGQGSSLQRLHYYEFANDPQNWVADPPQTGIGRDSDADQMEDWWEQLYGLSVGVDDSDLDPDLDGFKNLYEFLAKTSPQDPQSQLRLSIDSPPSGLKLGLSTVPDVAYTIQYADSFLSPISWADLMEISAESEERALLIGIDTTQTQRLFRVIIPAHD